MIQYILSITAKDHTGIVANLSDAICQLGGNLQAASQTVHQGYFAMVINCSFTDQVEAKTITDLIYQKAGDDLHVYITPYNPPPPTDRSNMQNFFVTAMGPDRPGILQKLSSYLLSKDINIDDLYCWVEDQNFIVICEVSVPDNLDIFNLQADLESHGKTLGVNIHMQHENIFTATNDLPLTRKGAKARC